MLEAEDMDDDYFTPASSTSLANIFGKHRKDDGSENESLKYTPPKPSKPEEPKSTQCIFACALLGYEWVERAYVPKGKLGFAIVKIIKTGFHNIVLYDSNKVTLSCATITSKFEVTVKENVYFSYHDNQQKYWSLNATEDEIKRIISLLESFNIVVKYSSDEYKGPPEVSTTDTLAVINKQVSTLNKQEEKESDTDSSINKRTKMSILNRMANMGQSVLPSRTIPLDKTSDSSDTNDTTNYKTIRHKPVKSSMKRNSSDKNLPESSLIEAEKIGSTIIEKSNNSIPLFTYVNGQLVPVTNTNVFTSPSNSSGNDMSYFISEQRINNSEIRINMNRMTDKVDQVLGKLCSLEQKDTNVNTNSFQHEILQKLLVEYEKKIKMYESLIKSQNLEDQLNTQFVGLMSQDSLKKAKDKNEDREDKIKELELLCQVKDEKIASLEANAIVLQNKYDEAIKKEKKSKEGLLLEIDNLKHDLKTRGDGSSNEQKQFDGVSQKDEDENIGSKLKNLMNDTFRALSVNFENDKEYSGERVKAVTAAVIKKVTIESLNNI